MLQEDFDQSLSIDYLPRWGSEGPFAFNVWIKEVRPFRSSDLFPDQISSLCVACFIS